MTGFEGAGFDHFCHLAVRQQTWQKTFVKIRRRWSAIVGIAGAISKPGFTRRQLQASASAEIADSGGR